MDTEDGSVVREGKPIKLQEQPFQLLVALLERNGEVVAREELRQRLWPGDTFVDFDKSLGVAITKLRDALDDEASNPRFIETLPRRGYRFIAPVERESEARTEAEEAKSVSGLTTSALPPSSAAVAPIAVEAPEDKRKISWLGVWVLLAGVAMAGVFVVRHFTLARTRRAAASEIVAPVSAPHVRRSLAILGFRNLPGRPEDAWLSAAFSEMLNTELAAGGELRLVAGEDIARAKRELPIADEDTLAKATLEKLQANPGADLVVLGSYAKVTSAGKNRLRLDIRVQDTGTGETVAEESLVGTEDGLFELAAQAGANLRGSIGLHAISGVESSGARATLPVNPRAVRLYSEGRAGLWNFDYLGARELLVKAVAADPNYPLAHAALSEAWWHLGYEARSRAEAQKALELSTHLPEEERLLVEAQYRRAVEDWPRAVEACKSLFHLFPDRLDYGLLLASAQRNVSTEDALKTLAALHQLPAPLGEDPRIDMLEAAAEINSDQVKARESAKRAIAKATAQGSHVLVAWTYGTLCQEGVGMSIATSEAIADCESARQMSVAVGDHNGAAMALNNLAAIYFQMGDLARSAEAFQQVMKQFREIGNLDGVATAMSNLGGVKLSQGDITAAKKYFEDAIPNYQAVEDHEGVALALNNLGDLSEQSGELDAAKINYEKAMVTARQIDNKSAEAYVLYGLGDVLYDRGEMAAARKSYEESLAMRKQLGEKQAVAETEVALAQISIQEHYAADAENVLRRCRGQFHQEQQADDELAASTELIDALLAQAKLAEARQEIQRDAALEKSSQNRLSQMKFSLAGARAVLASEHPEGARENLEKLLREAHERGFLGVELEARLAVAELERETGHVAAAHTQFAALQSAARAKGFGRIAALAGERL
ncbi:MAG TPA: tetratricopeptide repeat protein [Candidatus Acidoferrum sp.]|nr:tetratricopeptide repeat protein [Candidatus Acidoferrum sp.]